MNVCKCVSRGEGLAPVRRGEHIRGRMRPQQQDAGLVVGAESPCGDVGLPLAGLVLMLRRRLCMRRRRCGRGCRDMWCRWHRMRHWLRRRLDGGLYHQQAGPGSATGGGGRCIADGGCAGCAPQVAVPRGVRCGEIMPDPGQHAGPVEPAGTGCRRRPAALNGAAGGAARGHVRGAAWPEAPVPRAGAACPGGQSGAAGRRARPGSVRPPGPADPPAGRRSPRRHVAPGSGRRVFHPVWVLTGAAGCPGGIPSAGVPACGPTPGGGAPPGGGSAGCPGGMAPKRHSRMQSRARRRMLARHF